MKLRVLLPVALLLLNLVEIWSIPTPADYRVLGLEKYGALDEMYSGYMPIKLGENQEGSYFFWLVKQRNLSKKERLVVWLNGGPGCSSMVGMMFELGPFTVEAGDGFTKEGKPSGSPTHKPYNRPATSGPTDQLPPVEPVVPVPTEDGEISESNPRQRKHEPTKSPTVTPTAPKPPTPAPSDQLPPVQPTVPVPVPGSGSGELPQEPDHSGDVSPGIENNGNPRQRKHEPTKSPTVAPTAPKPPTPAPTDQLPPVQPIVPVPVPGTGSGELPQEPDHGGDVAAPMGRRGLDEQAGLPYKLVRNPYSWVESAHMLFLEQPIRTGFSKAAAGARKIDNEDEVANDFYHFMQSFLTVFSEFRDMDLYITGESYAGMYIPWIADKIVHEQLASDRDRQFYPGAPEVLKINLKGVAIGNGAIDEETTETTYAEYAYMHGLIPLEAKLHAESHYERCKDKKLVRGSRFITHGDISSCDTMRLVLDMAGKPNEYNTNTFRQYDNLVNPDGPFMHFMNDPEIQELLHVRGTNIPGLNFVPEKNHDQASTTRRLESSASASNLRTTSHEFKVEESSESQRNNNNVGTNSGDNTIRRDPVPTGSDGYYAPPRWVVCNDAINEGFGADRKIQSVTALQFIAKHIRVLLYSGEFDLNTNFLGTMKTLEKNTWLGKPFSSASRGLWMFNGDGAGEYYSIGDNFAFLLVRKSGHLLPGDLPDVALELFNRFLEGKSFSDIPLPSASTYASHVNGLDAVEGAVSDLAAVTGRSNAGLMVMLLVIAGVLVATVYVARRSKDTAHHHTREAPMDIVLGKIVPSVPDVSSTSVSPRTYANMSSFEMEDISGKPRTYGTSTDVAGGTVNVSTSIASALNNAQEAVNTSTSAFKFTRMRHMQYQRIGESEDR